MGVIRLTITVFKDDDSFNVDVARYMKTHKVPASHEHAIREKLSRTEYVQIINMPKIATEEANKKALLGYVFDIVGPNKKFTYEIVK
jgi:hypothetical protein